MSAARSLDELSPDVRKEIELLALRVTQGFPAYQSLQSVLTDDEWSQIEAELQQYFPSPELSTDAGTAKPKSTESPQATVASTPKSAPPASESVVSTPEATVPVPEPATSIPAVASPVSDPAASPPRRPPYYAIKTLMKLREVSQCRAILELALATDLLTDVGYRRLLREIGEQGEPPPAPLPPARDTVLLPEWNKQLGELRLGGELIKRIRRPSVAKNIARVLDAFQEQGWPRHISDPLLGGRDQKRLHDTILSLNEDLDGIRFHGDGTGGGIYWDLIPSP